VDGERTLNKESDWKLYSALREQWTHEDNLVNHREMWLILSQGLLYNAYGTFSVARFDWLVFAFPFFGMLVAALIGIGIFASIGAAEEVSELYRKAGLDALDTLMPSRCLQKRGKWAAKALPFVFCGIWLLAMAGTLAR
jgi:hypothetical protein